MKVAKVPESREAEFLRDFSQNSMFTFEGIDIESKEGRKSLDKLETILRATGFNEKECIGYKFKGEVMNRICELSGNNRYPDDLTFLVIPNYYNPVVKLQVGARWFDDILCNNTIRENALKYGLEPDFGGYGEESDDE